MFLPRISENVYCFKVNLSESYICSCRLCIETVLRRNTNNTFLVLNILPCWTTNCHVLLHLFLYCIRDPTPQTSTVDNGRTIQWTPVTPQRMNYLLIQDTRLSMREHPRPDKVSLWNLHIPALVNQAVSKAKSENQFFVFRDKITFFFLGLSLFLVVVVLCLVVCITQGARQNDKYKKLLRGNSTTSSNYPVNL